MSLVRNSLEEFKCCANDAIHFKLGELKLCICLFGGWLLVVCLLFVWVTGSLLVGLVIIEHLEHCVTLVIWSFGTLCYFGDLIM